MMDRRTMLAGLGALGTASALGAGPAAAQTRGYILASGNTGGTFYPVGVAFSTLVKVQLQNAIGMDLSTITSAGSGENIRLMRDGLAQFGMLQGLFGIFARDGAGPMSEFGPQTNLRSITNIFANVEHFILRNDLVETGTISDMANMAGRSFSMAARNSGTMFSNQLVFRNLGIDYEAMELVYQGYLPSIEAMQNGTLDAHNPNGGVPIGAVTQLMSRAADRFTILEFTDEQIAEADGGTGLFYRFVIEPGTYPGIDRPINTMAQPQFLAVNADVPDDDVYAFTRTVFENLPFLNNIHAATRQMTHETAMLGLVLPIHPGAARYFDEVGVAIPDRLRPA